MFEVDAEISQNTYTSLSNHIQLLKYINRLLSICGSSRSYKFVITFWSDEKFATNVIESLLQMDAIKRCSTFKIRIHRGKQNQLPIKAISNWLEKYSNKMENNVQNQDERFLEIGFRDNENLHGIENAQEILTHLKTVYF